MQENKSGCFSLNSRSSVLRKNTIYQLLSGRRWLVWWPLCSQNLVGNTSKHSVIDHCHQIY